MLGATPLTSDVVRLVARAWRFVDSEPDAALHSARKAAETICLHVFVDTVSPNAGHMSLEDMVSKLTRSQALPQRLGLPLKTVQTYGNFGVHSQTDDTPIDGNTVRTCLSALDEIVRWYFTSYLKKPVPPELQDLAGVASRATSPSLREGAVPSEARSSSTIRSRPVVLLAAGMEGRGAGEKQVRTVVVGTDAGEWFAIGANSELDSLPPTGPFGAAVVDPAGVITVACWEPSVKQMRCDAATNDRETWSEIMLGASPLSLALTERGVVAGDTEGGLAIVPTSSRIPVQDLTAGEPIVELCALGDAIVVLGASGALDVTTWPYHEAPLKPVDTTPIGRPYAMFPGTQPRTAIVVGRRGFAVLVTSRDGTPTLTSIVDVAGPIRGIASFRDRDRACVYTDAGDAWVVDGSLAKVARIRLAEMGVTGATPTPDGTVLLWTADGDLHVVAHDGAVRRVAERDVVLAAPDPDRAGGYIAIHWNAAAGARVTRGRAAWT